MRCPGALRCGGPQWGAQRPVKGGWNTCPLKRIVPSSRPRMHPWNLYTERTNGNPNRLSGAPRHRAVLGRCLGPRETRIVNSPSPGTGQQLERSAPIIFLPFPGNTRESQPAPGWGMAVDLQGAQNESYRATCFPEVTKID